MKNNYSQHARGRVKKFSIGHMLPLLGRLLGRLLGTALEHGAFGQHALAEMQTI